MSQIRKRIKTVAPNPENPFEKALEQELYSFSSELAQILNKGLLFADNFNAETKTITDSGVADSQNTVAHTLKRVPAGFVVLKINKGGVVYDSGTAWTDTAIYLKCSAANAAITLLVY
jgi:hypothetical protein